MTYIISWLEQTTEAIIQRRPWWNLFGKDSLLLVTRWKRHVITTDKKPDFETLILVVSSLKSATHLQVEEGTFPTQYITTLGKTNSIKNTTIPDE
jgi:hypothetical protein